VIELTPESQKKSGTQSNRSHKKTRLAGGFHKNGAGDAIRTRDIFLGKEVLYH
jgi:hypothetical protein